MVRNSGNLTHHEELRLDYLQKNIHYLNEREQKELAYLEYKSEGHSLPRTSYQQERQGRFKEQELDEDILPSYPREERSRRSRERKATGRPQKKPRKKGRIKRFLMTLLFLLLLVIGGMVFMFVKGLNSTSSSSTSTEAKAAQTEVFNGEDTTNGVNILVLGTDGRIGESSGATRTDSIMVVNVNNEDGKVKIISFMRDTLINIEGNDYKINVTYSFGEQNNNQGAENVRQVLKENFDIDIKYYALVDFSTFATAIDTLFPEGVTIDAQFSTINGETVTSVDVPDDLNMENGVVPTQTIQVGEQQMDGRTLLNYARFRKDDEGDYGRTRRQQQVLSAILTQVQNPTKLFTGSEALGKVFSLTSTNLPYSFILTNGVGAALDASNGIETTTIPENNDWVEEYDVYGGSGLKIDFEKYKTKLSELGFR